jgi:excisionase family DNA binding protein
MDKAEHDERLYRASEVKRILGDLSNDKLNELISSGHLPVITLPGAGRYRRFRRSDIDRLMQEAV